jgi:hypothetical protein
VLTAAGEGRVLIAAVAAAFVLFQAGGSLACDPLDPSGFGIPHIGAFPFGGSAMVMWDTGIPAPPTTNTPPRQGQDPHGAPRNSSLARRQKSEFLRVDGAVVDVCGDLPCVP